MSRRKCPKHGRRHSHSRYEPVFILDPDYLNRNLLGSGQVQLLNRGHNPGLLMRCPQTVWNDTLIKPVPLNVLQTPAVAPVQLQSMGIGPNELVQRTAPEGAPLQVIDGRVPLVILNGNQQPQQTKIHKGTDPTSLENVWAQSSNHQMASRRKKKKQQAKREHSKAAVNKEDSSSSAEEEEFFVSKESDFPFENRPNEIYMMKRINKKGKVNKHVFAKNESSSFSHGTNNAMASITNELINQNLATQKRIDGLSEQINELKACICPSEGDLEGTRAKSAQTTQTEVRRMLKLNGIQNIALVPADQWKPCNCMGGSGSRRSSGLRRSKSSAVNVAEHSQHGLGRSSSRVGATASEEDSVQSILCPWNHNCKCCENPSVENSYHITDTYFAATDNNIYPNLFPNCSNHSEKNMTSNNTKCIPLHRICEANVRKPLLEVFWSIFIITLGQCINNSAQLQYLNQGDSTTKRYKIPNNEQSKYVEASNKLYEKGDPSTLNRGQVNLDEIIFVKNVFGTYILNENYFSSIKNQATSLNSNFDVCPFLGQQSCALPNSTYDTALNLCDKFSTERKRNNCNNRRRKRKRVLSEKKMDTIFDQNRKTPECFSQKEKIYAKMPCNNSMDDKRGQQSFLDARKSDGGGASKCHKEIRFRLKKSEDKAMIVNRGECEACDAQYESDRMRKGLKDSAGRSHRCGVLKDCLCPPQKEYVGTTCKCATGSGQRETSSPKKRDACSQTVAEWADCCERFGGVVNARRDKQMLLRKHENDVIKRWLCKPLIEDVYSTNPDTGCGQTGHVYPVDTGIKTGFACKSCQVNENIGEERHDFITARLSVHDNPEYCGLDSSKCLCEECKARKTTFPSWCRDVLKKSIGVQCKDTYLWNCDYCNKWNVTVNYDSDGHHTWQCKKCKVTIVQPICDVKIQEETNTREGLCICCRCPSEETVYKRYREIREAKYETDSCDGSDNSANINNTKICCDCEERRGGWRCKECIDVQKNKDKSRQEKCRDDVSLCRYCRSVENGWVCKTCDELKPNKIDKKENDCQGSGSDTMLCRNCRRTNGHWVCDNCDPRVEKSTERSNYYSVDSKTDNGANTYRILPSSSSHLISKRDSMKTQRNVLFVRKSSKSILENKRFFGPNNNIFVKEIQAQADIGRTDEQREEEESEPSELDYRSQVLRHRSDKMKQKSNEAKRAYRTSIKSGYGYNRRRSEKYEPSFYHCVYETRNERRFGVTRSKSSSTDSGGTKMSRINTNQERAHTKGMLKNKSNTGQHVRSERRNSGSLEDRTGGLFKERIRFDKKSGQRSDSRVKSSRLTFKKKNRPMARGIFIDRKKTRDLISTARRSKNTVPRVLKEKEDSGNRRMDNASDKSSNYYRNRRTRTLILRQLLKHSVTKKGKGTGSNAIPSYYIKKVEWSKHKRSIYVVVKKKQFARA